MIDYDKALSIITRLELIQMKDLPYTPDQLIEKFGMDEIGFFYDKICKENKHGSI